MTKARESEYFNGQRYVVQVLTSGGWLDLAKFYYEGMALDCQQTIEYMTTEYNPALPARIVNVLRSAKR